MLAFAFIVGGLFLCAVIVYADWVVRNRPHWL